MPEGDTVWLSGHRLREALEGDVVTRSDFRVPRHATADLSGRVIESIASRGKHLLWRFSGGVTMHTHFRMDGSWQLHRPNRTFGGPWHEVRAVIETNSRVAVGWRIPVLDLLPSANEQSVVGHLGPDLLGDDWDPELATSNLEARSSMQIGEALLDQTALAGLGNVYRCELCFLRGVDPFTPVGEVRDLGAMVGLAKRLMDANRLTARHITTGDTRRGRAHYVYGRMGRPCLRCGSPIRRGHQESYGDERVVYWCPTCQPRTPVPATLPPRAPESFPRAARGR